jgi:hypothetical protein
VSAVSDAQLLDRISKVMGYINQTTGGGGPCCLQIVQPIGEGGPGANVLCNFILGGEGRGGGGRARGWTRSLTACSSGGARTSDHAVVLSAWGPWAWV